ETLCRIKDLQRIVEVARNERRIGEGAIVEQVVPPEGSRRVSPAEPRVVAEGRVGAASVRCQKEPVVIVRSPVVFGVHIEEVYEVVLVSRAQEEVGIRTTRRHNVRALFLAYRPFQHDTARHGTDAACAVKLTVVSVFRSYFQYGRKSAAESSGNAALIQF